MPCRAATGALLLLSVVLALALVAELRERPLTDYTVVGRAAWEVGDRSGELTLVLNGRERVVAVDWSCYVSAVVGIVLPERVQLVAQDAIVPEGATVTCRGP